jgi:rod shape-determining protein MreB
MVTGLPNTIPIASEEMREALNEPVTSVVEAIHSVFERTPPELSSDISERGIVMTGGSSLLNGLDKLITQRTGINAIVAENAVSAVATGTGKFIEYISSERGRPDITMHGLSEFGKGGLRGRKRDD